MLNYKEAIIGLAFLTIIMTNGAVYGSFKAKTKTKSKVDEAQQQGILESFEQNDYLVWRKLVCKNNELMTIVNEGQFKKFIAARNAARSGLYEQSIVLAKSLEAELRSALGEALSI